MLIHVIADFGAADLAFAEVCQRIKLLIPDAEVLMTPVPPFATLAAGFCAAQLALNDAPRDMAVFHNVAPRKDDATARLDNAGEGLACLVLPSGVRVVGVNAGYAFSFLRPHATEFRNVAVARAGSQFRSRDIFPAALARVLSGNPEALGDEVAADSVPAVPDSRIAYVDGFGNIKTSLSSRTPLKPGALVTVGIAGVRRRAYVADGGFSVPHGELALSVGSSGWNDPDGTAFRFRELFLRGGSAWDLFDRPATESEITLETDTGAQLT